MATPHTRSRSAPRGTTAPSGPAPPAPPPSGDASRASNERLQPRNSPTGVTTGGNRSVPQTPTAGAALGAAASRLPAQGVGEATRGMRSTSASEDESERRGLSDGHVLLMRLCESQDGGMDIGFRFSGFTGGMLHCPPLCLLALRWLCGRRGRARPPEGGTGGEEAAGLGIPQALAGHLVCPTEIAPPAVHL